MSIVQQNTKAGLARDYTTEGLGVLLLLGVFLDGWAHLNRQVGETFFTPWHGLLYGALAATALWTAAVAWTNRRPGYSLLKTLPPGYRATAAGTALFGVGGLFDWAWHQAFGIEVGVDALVSPTHLLLAAGGLLILSTGLRTALPSGSSDPEVPWPGPAWLSLVLMTGLASFFLIYTSAFTWASPTTTFVLTPEGTPGHEESELPVIAGLAGYLLTTVLVMVPFLLALIRAPHLPKAFFTLLVGTVAWLSVAIVEFPVDAAGGAVGATIAAAAVDVVLACLPDDRLRRRVPIVAAGAAGLLWAGQLAGLALADAIRWPVPLWTGVIILSSGVAAGLGILTVQPRAVSVELT